VRFGDRCCGDLRLHRLRWDRYLAQLHDHGYRAGQVEYALFAGEVFHDAPFAARQSGSSVSVSARNVFLRDVLSRRNLDLPDEHWNVEMQFLNAKLTHRSGPKIPMAYYHQSELWRASDHHVLEIELRDPSSSNDAEISIEFERLEAVLPAVAFQECGPDPLRCRDFTPACSDPEWWREHWDESAAQQGFQQRPPA